MVLAAAIGWLLGRPPLLMARWSVGSVMWGVLAAVPPLAVVITSTHFSIEPFARLSRVVEGLLASMFPYARWVDLAIVSALAGLGEEMLFRGVLQAQITRSIGGPAGPWVGLVVAAVVFGLLHWLTLAYAVFAMAIGLYLGWLWIATGNLLTPIVTHAVYDFVVLVYLVKVRGRRREKGLGIGD